MGILSAIYRLGLSCDKFLTKPHKLPVRVVSIGNITTGGTGKTPAVMSVALEAKKRGFNPCILTRGYKGKTKDTCFVSREDGPVMSASEAGDEAFLIADLLRGVPVVKGSNRYEAGLLAKREYFDTLPPAPRPLTPLFILDDGFQHWALARDINVVLIDATNPFGNRKLLPEGPLREPLKGLNRADIILLTKSDITTKGVLSDTVQTVKKHSPAAPVFSASHKPIELINTNGEVRTLDSLSKKKICAFSALANAFSFKSLLKAHGAQIVQFKNYRDHYLYKQKDMDAIKKDALGLDIITTEKDLVKIRELQVPGNVYALRIKFSVAEDFYTDLFRRL